MILEQYNKVVEFMNLANQSTSKEQRAVSYKSANFRLTLIKEELQGNNELIDSMCKDDRNGVLDGICDVLYVVYGALATYGLTPAPFITKACVAYNKVPTAGTTHYHIRSLNNMLEKYERSMLTDDLYELKNSCDNIIRGVYAIGEIFGLNVVEAFDEVHASNMSKFAFTKHDAQAAIEAKVKEDNKDYIGASVVEVGDYYAIKRKSDGKILKPTTFFEPDLSKFL